jgi:protein TonB
MDFFFKFRRLLSGPPAIIIAIIIITTPITRVVERIAQKDQEFAVSLYEPPPPPPPPPPPEVVNQPVRPQSVELQPVQPADVITKESVVIETKPAPPPPEAPRAAETPKPVDAPPAPPVTRAGPTLGQIQSGYEGIIRNYLESIKRYPTSREARSQRPQGKVGIWIEVNRDGSLKDAGILKSSDYIILDNAALSTIRNGKYPPFPADAYPGQTSHRFSATLEYIAQTEN